MANSSQSDTLSKLEPEDEPFILLSSSRVEGDQKNATLRKRSRRGARERGPGVRDREDLGTEQEGVEEIPQAEEVEQGWELDTEAPVGEASEKARGRERERLVREVMARKGPEMVTDQGEGALAREILAVVGRVCLTPDMWTIRSLFTLDKLAIRDTRGKSCCGWRCYRMAG